jgi:hypothetical protein
LHANANAGSSSLSINALPDAATNVLRAGLTGGQFLLLGVPGTQQELVQIAVGGVPTTSLGYTSATVTLTGSTINGHSAGDPVVESPGVNYDALAQFGFTQFSF